MIKITIDTENPQFQDNNLKPELGKIFDQILGKIDRSDTFGLFDSNGNIIGNFRKE